MKDLKYCVLKYKELIIILLLVLSGVGCAKIGTPSGGPKDVTPPKVLQTIPARGTTHFKGKRVEITFDEFIQLVDINKYFVSSPPLKKTPLILLRGKSLVITLEEPLKDSSTYRFYFGDAIADLNEKNVLKNYDFVLSTGSHIDSLSLRGRVVDAFTLKPDKESVYVMLYNHFEDSVPRKQLPQYITKTNEKGWFAITNIKAGRYMILALKDMNQNYLFDLPSEPIAFSDTLININKHYFFPDSLIKADTTSADTVNRAPFPTQIKLYSFVENHEKQFLKKAERNSPERFTITFNLPVRDSLPMKLLNSDKKNWNLPDFPTFKRDSMVYWITDTSLVRKDTLELQLTYDVKDSLGNWVPKHDTISLTNKKLPANRRKVQQAPVPKFAIGSLPESNSILDLNKRFMILPSHPLASIDRNKIELLRINEDKRTKINYRIVKDSIFLRKYYVDFKFEPNTNYELVMDSAAFTSIYRQHNDSTGIKFTTQKDDYYGTIRLSMQHVTTQMIIQLYKGDRELVQEKVIDKDQVVSFEFLDPGTYHIKAVYDTNRNKKWDTGDFAKKVQPEKVAFYPADFTVRSNWSIEETWNLQ